MARTRQHLSKYLPASALLLSSIALYAIALLYLPFLVWIALAPQLALSARSSRKTAMMRSALFSASVALIGFHWTITYSPATYAYAFLMYGLFLLLFLVGSDYLLRHVSGMKAAVLIPSWWMALMVLYSFSPLGTFVFNLAAYQPMLAPLIWIIGSQGITFLIILSNALLALSIHSRGSRYLISASLLLVLISGCFLYSAVAAPEGNPVTLSLIQGNVEESWSWRIDHAQEILERYITLSMTAAEEEPDLIIWPEYALPMDLSSNQSAQERVRRLANRTGSIIILGAFDSLERWDEDGNLIKRDQAWVFFPDGDHSTYTAIEPLPFETWTLPAENRQGPLELGHFRAGLGLCYETTQRALWRQHKKEGAEVFVALSNNQRFSRTAGLYLANVYGRVQAAEHGVYLLQASNTGMTWIIDPYGKRVAELPANEQGILTATIRV